MDVLCCERGGNCRTNPVLAHLRRVWIAISRRLQSRHTNAESSSARPNSEQRASPFSRLAAMATACAHIRAWSWRPPITAVRRVAAPPLAAAAAAAAAATPLLPPAVLDTAQLLYAVSGAPGHTAPGHPECAERVPAILQALSAASLTAAARPGQARLASIAPRRPWRPPA